MPAVDPSQVGGAGLIVALLGLIGKLVLRDQSGQERLAEQYEKQWHDCEAKLVKVEEALDHERSRVNGLTHELYIAKRDSADALKRIIHLESLLGNPK